MDNIFSKFYVNGKNIFQKNEKNKNDIFFDPIDISDNTIPNGNSIMLINLIRLGMKKEANSENNVLPYGENFWKSLNSKTIVYDLIYNPAPTPLLKYCDKKGCRTIDGTQMLIAQGAKSLSFWTNGLEVPFEIMRNALKKYL